MNSTGRVLPRCYVASPLGFTAPGRHYYREVLLPALAAVVTPVDPWTLTSEQEVKDAQVAGRQHELTLEIGRRNVEAIESCVLLAACLDGQEVDSGTAAEIGFAAARGLRCFGVRTDLRQAGEDGALVNLQVETFIVRSGGRISSSLEELTSDLAQAGLR